MTAPTQLRFDERFYIEINEARWSALQRMLAAVRKAAPVSSILDVGCGPGWFSSRLVQAGFQVSGLEGRPENVEEARRRVPQAAFEVLDFDGDALKAPPARHDAVLAFGLLYHLENPLRALRFCRAAARHTLFLETQIIPEPGPWGRLIAESPDETQGLNSMALVLTPDAIVAALTRLGFARVHRLKDPTAHVDFKAGPDRRQKREMWVATDLELEDEALERLPPARPAKYDYRAPR
jgi:SAM-dependent methyltransferase